MDFEKICEKVESQQDDSESTLSKQVNEIKWLVSKETLCCVGGQVKQLVDYQLEVDKGKLTAVANLKS